MIEQTPFGPKSYAENPEERLACVLLLDVSGSMNGPPITELNAGLQTYRDALFADSLAAKRVEVAIVTFGGGQVQTVCDFTTVDGFHPPTLTGGGDTPMGAAILQGIEMVTNQKRVYKANRVPYKRPWLFLITDGAPTDVWEPAAARVKQGEGAKEFLFYAVGVEGANFDILKQISVSDPLKLKGLRFQDLFKWLSDSQSAASRAAPGQSTPLTDPTAGPNGWGTVPG